jgi:hypothetical protein
VYLHKIDGGGGSADPAHADILVLVSRLPRLLYHSGIVLSERKIVLSPGGNAGEPHREDRSYGRAGSAVTGPPGSTAVTIPAGST